MFSRDTRLQNEVVPFYSLVTVSMEFLYLALIVAAFFLISRFTGGG